MKEKFIGVLISVVFMVLIMFVTLTLLAHVIRNEQELEKLKDEYSMDIGSTYYEQVMKARYERPKITGKQYKDQG